MNYGSLVNLNIIQKIGTFFDIIPKIIYFLFAALTAGIDAMQALIRKLAGLDTYYQNLTGEAMTNKDPLTEFIYGILGIGDTAEIYRGLNTVFWSLAIFGLIILVVSTIIAIIKSHYNEDSESTNPWKYIYTAIKSILTFAVIPVLVVFGMQLSSFVLKTLDNITAGTSSEATIKEVYGAQATEIFKGETMEGQETKSYGNYDLFGFGSPTNTSTFGGMLFKASAYSANRARNGRVTVANYQNIKVNDKQIFGDASNCPEFASLQTATDRADYVATQIDFAFTNCLQLQTGISYSETISVIGDGAPYLKASDIFGINKSSVTQFSKFDVSFVWLFYNLWQFNFIVAFGGGIAIFGIMISIIIGMMTRLLKGAALFLVYPAILGIAPLDNFKAFKNWGTTFIQQIMMAFGSIIGINLLLLILPYLQSISFFNIEIVDYIVNVVILIAGLMMAKDFINMVSGFVGGADASTTGDGYKGNIASGFKRGIGIAGKGGATVAKVGAHAVVGAGKVVGKAAIGAGKTVGNIAKKVRSSHAAQKATQLTKRQQKIKSSAAERFDDAIDAVQRAQAKKQAIINNATKISGDKLNKAAAKAYNSVIKKGGSKKDAEDAQNAVLKNGVIKLSLGDRLKLARLGITESMNNFHANQAAREYDAYDANALIKKFNLVEGADKNGNKKMLSTFNLSSALGSTFTGTMKSIFVGNKKDEDGKPIIGGLVGDVAKIGKTMADGFIKTVKEGLGEGMGLDKLLSGTNDLIKGMWHTKGVKGKMFGEGANKLEGDKLQQKLADDQTKSINDLSSIMKTGFAGLTKASKETTQAMNKLYQLYSQKNNNPPPSGNNP